MYKKYKNYNQWVEKANALIVDRYSRKKKLPRKDFNQLIKIIETFKQHIKPPIQQPKTSSLPTKSGRDMSSTLIIQSFEIEQDYFEIQLPPEVHELIDINTAIKQKISGSDFKFNIEADIISMKSVVATSNIIQFNSELNTLLLHQ